MDAFKRALHATVSCTGGLYCPWDRPRGVTGHAGQRRLSASKVRSRRYARGILKMDARAQVEEAFQEANDARLAMEDEEAMQSLDASYYQDFLDYKYDQVLDSDCDLCTEIDWSEDPAYFTDWSD